MALKIVRRYDANGNVIEDKDLERFRSYKKGADSEYDGLQVYKDGKLLADCETPKGFKVVGYIAPYYYSQIIGGEEDGSMMVYRFKLD